MLIQSTKRIWVIISVVKNRACIIWKAFRKLEIKIAFKRQGGQCVVSIHAMHRLGL